MAQPVFDVFFCYNKADQRAVKRLAERLERELIRVWLDEWNLVPGVPWQPELERALMSCRSVAVLFGRKGVSPWQREEMQAAVNRRVKETHGLFRLVPVLLPGTAQESVLEFQFLPATTWVEFHRTLDDEEALHRLLCGIRGLEPGKGVRAYNTKRRSQYFFIVDGTINEVDQTRVEAIVGLLRKYSGDVSLTLTELSEGSVKLLLEGTTIGFERLEFLWRTGQLNAVLGRAVRDLRIAGPGSVGDPAGLARQVEDDTNSAPKASADDPELLQKRESLNLSRMRVLRELETSQNPRYRNLMEKALKDLDEELSRLEREKQHSWRLA
jgi:hypothetical protein